MDDVELKLSAARTRLILDKPFLGALALRLPMKAADARWCPTTATDARGFFFNPAYIQELSLAQTQFVLAHEALHCALSHFARRGHRDRRRWDLACDLAVNPLLVADGLPPPPNAFVIREYEGMTAEEIYPLLDDMDGEPQDRHVYDEGSGTGGAGGAGAGTESRPEGGGREGEPDAGAGGAPMPPPLTAEEKPRLETQWQQRLAGAAQQARQAGRLAGAMARLVDHLLQPRLPWRMLLARHLSFRGREDFSYARPSRREGPAILPSLRSHEIEIAIGLDTSGSVGDGELNEFLSEVNALKGQLRARITLLPCDARLMPGAPFVFEPWEEVRFEGSVTGGGGTSFRPVFEWIGKQDRIPEVLVYFTDALGEFPAREPDYPVLWLVKGRGPVPWGQRIQLN
jgi:predicted metal-dependent peptidase